VRAPDSVRFDPLRLRALPIAGGTPLGSLASFTTAESRMSLERENQQQMIAITADVSGRSLGGVTAMRQLLAEQPPPPVSVWRSAVSTRASRRRSAPCCSCCFSPR
jgi:Cu/Ag efflux pump CusA